MDNLIRRLFIRRSFVRWSLVFGTGLAAMLVFASFASTWPVSALSPTPEASATPEPAPACPLDETCHPTEGNRPVCGRGAPPECATFIDPTVTIEEPENINLGRRIYIGPFAELYADDDAEITIRNESNVQDNVTIFAKFDRDDDGDSDDDGNSGNAEARMAAIGLNEDSGVEVEERCILAHGATIKGPAKIGVGGGDIEVDPDDDQEVFLSFGVEVDGAIMERNTGMSALSRLGPGVVLKSGLITLPGKNLTTQADVGTFDSPGPKVRLLTAADIAFNEAVIEVNTSLAREYTRLFYENPSNVRGINFDPGNTHFNPVRNLPVTSGMPVITEPEPGGEGGLTGEFCVGQPTRDPDFRNRIIGAVCLGNTREQLDSVMGNRIALRADEGEPFSVGRIRFMSNDVIFHALEFTPIRAGNNVFYGRGAIVHGGGRDPIAGGGANQETVLDDDVTLRALSVVFRSRIAAGETVGFKSAVVNTDTTLVPGTTIPDRTVYVNNVFFGRVEW